jgi:hypothetical protein
MKMGPFEFRSIAILSGLHTDHRSCLAGRIFLLDNGTGGYEDISASLFRHTSAANTGGLWRLDGRSLKPDQR